MNVLEVDAILALKEAFQKPMNEILNTLHTCDNGCSNQHYTKVVSKEYDNDTCSFIDLKGHPLVCYDNDTQCRSKLSVNPLSCFKKFLTWFIQWYEKSHVCSYY